MYGISVFLGEDLTEEIRTYIQEMSHVGVKGIFTSLHIPEENSELYAQRLKELGEIASKNEMKLMVDISGEALNRAGFSFESLEEITAIGVTGLRMDYAISNQKIAQVSQVMNVGLNASTITSNDVKELKHYKADFSNFEAWHNYYPRPETGLGSSSFSQKNQWLKESGFKVFAFVPGDDRLRGPLFQGLPTLERHRYEHPLAAMIELKERFAVDGVYIGDPMISKRTMRQLALYLEQDELVLEANDLGSRYYSMILGTHVNRQDDARDVIRSADARFKKIPTIEAEKLIIRTLGSVTIDNSSYGRYMGEIQVTKKDLPADEKVNVVAQIVTEDQALLKCINAGSKFKLINEGTL
ncbi:DUF871 domain-containing protein [Enterococcus wangshanyuanii]|uniref:Histidine kinase n=1 Tax=Enterococcus wangshanyuanii TaxID=2005703 RepID=A0ABQ1NXX3_9ENTE|nr:MupG family TIM beta-alpha barrel fold protein [Enterococcus wangshanyuanii]GGC82756.1 hypothetical protein GCM10011573_10500 [Enterococcus wangshanyuanii]